MKKANVQAFETERQMLETFIANLFMKDPDMLIAHNLCGGVFETLINRINMLRINHWSRIGRFKRAQMPKQKNDSFGYGGSQWVPRLVSCGRLLVDTFLSCRELVRETTYDLSHLARTQLPKEQPRKEFDLDQLPQFYITSGRILELAEHTQYDAYLTFQLMHQLQVIPLTKQLTSIAGNLWFRSL